MTVKTKGRVYGTVQLFVSVETDKQDDEAIRDIQEKINILTAELNELKLMDANYIDGHKVLDCVKVNEIDSIKWSEYVEE